MTLRGKRLARETRVNKHDEGHFEQFLAGSTLGFFVDAIRANCKGASKGLAKANEVPGFSTLVVLGDALYEDDSVANLKLSGRGLHSSTFQLNLSRF